MFRFWKVFWIDATDAETVVLSLREIARNLDAQASGIEDSTESVLLWFSTTTYEWLLVFDNADGEPDTLAKYLPRGQGNILITSRNPDMRRNVLPGAWDNIDEMEKDDAISLLLKAACLDWSSNDLRRLSEPIVTELCCLPLAVDQAGAAIASGLCDICSYLQMYSKHRLTLMDYPSFQGASNYGRAVYGTWNLSFTALEAKATGKYNPKDVRAAESAILILQTFAFLHHENISEEIFLRAAEAQSRATVPNKIIINKYPQMAFNLHCQLLQLDEKNKWDALSFRKAIQV